MVRTGSPHLLSIIYLDVECPAARPLFWLDKQDAVLHREMIEHLRS